MDRYKSIDFSRYSSIKIGQKEQVLVIEEVGEYNDFHIIGLANNLIVSPDPSPLAILSKEQFAYIDAKSGYLKVGGATPSGRIASYAKKHNISGFEYLSKLPGTLGGLVKMNAGMKEYEIFENLVMVKTQAGYIEKKDIDFGYRYAKLDSIIYEAVFEIHKGWSDELVQLFASMRANQPKDPSAGSAFKNPPGDAAGRLIDAVGLKGKRVGGMAWSEQHANFLVNLGNGTYEHAMHLIDEVKRCVNEEFGIALELEVEII
jgi:UDP-N-acetylmuramate dehydrogenase